MKVAIVGASGQTGHALIDEALARGHEVIAIARSPEKFNIEDPRVTKRKGDGFDAASMISALEGAEAIITTVGKTDLRDKRYNLSSAAHQSVMQAMREHDIKRLLVISSIGAAQGIKRKGLRRNIYLWLRRKYYLDMFQMEEELAASEFDVTIVRAPMLYNGPARRDYQVLEDENYFNVLKISRADIAGFLLDDLEQGTWVNRRITVAEPADA